MWEKVYLRDGTRMERISHASWSLWPCIYFFPSGRCRAELNRLLSRKGFSRERARALWMVTHRVWLLMIRVWLLGSQVHVGGPEFWAPGSCFWSFEASIPTPEFGRLESKCVKYLLEPDLGSGNCVPSPLSSVAVQAGHLF